MMSYSYSSLTMTKRGRICFQCICYAHDCTRENSQRQFVSACFERPPVPSHEIVFRRVILPSSYPHYCVFVDFPLKNAFIPMRFFLASTLGLKIWAKYVQVENSQPINKRVFILILVCKHSSQCHDVHCP